MKMDRPYSSDSYDRQAYRIAFLIAGFIQNRLTPEEHRELDDWVTASIDNQLLFEELTDPATIQAGKATLRRSRPDELLRQVKDTLQFKTPERIIMLRRVWRYLGAACVLLVVSVTFLRRQNFRQSNMSRQWVTKDLPPGCDKATLILANGIRWPLDSTVKGTLATQGGASVQKDDSGRLVYQLVASNQTATTTAFNVLQVPRGGEFQLRLSDGTKVWLNAESYLRYPSVFTGKQRTVELYGEGYFEVANDSHRPFIVQVGKVETQVLGTSFNINSYPEKKTIQVTLAHGTVRVVPVNTFEKGALLRPGQQAQVDQAANEMKIVPANLVTTLAWKDRLFVFQNTSLDEVLAQISRWYNVTVIDSTTSTMHFNASISRNVPVSMLLHILEQTREVRFRIYSGKITATN